MGRRFMMGMLWLAYGRCHGRLNAADLSDFLCPSCGDRRDHARFPSRRQGKGKGRSPAKYALTRLPHSSFGR